MSNIQPESIIALLNCSDHIEPILDSSMWIAGRLNRPIALMYCNPSSHQKQAIDYSGRLTIDNKDQMIQEFTDKEHDDNLITKNKGKLLLQTAQQYCVEHLCKQPTYLLHRQCKVTESINYIDKQASLIVTAPSFSCNTTLESVIRTSQCPILVTHTDFKTPTSALLAFDDKETSHRLVDWLCDSPMVRNICIHIVMVSKEDSHNTDALQEAYAKLTQSGIKCKKKILDCTDISAALLYYQKEHKLDLLMTGSFGRSRLREWLNGSRTEQLLDSHHSPYLLYPKDH